MKEKQTEKVQTAVFGKDLRVVKKKYHLSKSGNKIDIVSSGEGYFMPEIGPTHFLDMPTRKRFFLFGQQLYERTYFVLKKGSKCVDFGDGTGIIYGPDGEQVKIAVGNTLLPQINKEKIDLTWKDWAILVMTGLTFLMVLNMSGVLR